MPLTAAQVLQAKPTAKTQKLFDGGGMFLEVTPSGGKRWRLKYRFGGKENLLSLGVYPGTTLAQAREARELARSLLKAGTDPSQQRKIEKLTRSAAAENTFEAIALEWHTTKKSGWSEVHTNTVMARMTNNLFPWIGRKPLVDLKAQELLATLRRIEGRGAIDTTHRAHGIMSEVFRFAIATGRAESNPAADLGAGLKTAVKGHRPAIVEPTRYAAMIRDIDSYGGSYVTRAALKIHALTCQRPNEVTGMAWAELDFDQALWTIPALRMKRRLSGKINGQPHLVPLSKQVIDVLKDMQPLTGLGALVFPSERGQGRTISENTCRQALRSMGYTDHVPHGFRASIRTLAREVLHFDKEVIERLLSHGSDEALGGAYDRTQFMQERARLMQAWADYGDRLRTGDNVVKLKAA